MPRRSDVITLVKLTPHEVVKNERSITNIPGEEHRTVRGNREAVWNAEVFRAMQEGFDVRLRFKLFAAEYDGEQEAIFEGKRLRVLRAEETGNGEFVRLTLSALPVMGGGLM